MANEFKVKHGLKFPDNTTQTTAAQAVLVSGTNIKTINNTTLLGSGDITVSTVSALDDLSDVVITTPTNNQVLKYNGTNWVNGTSSGGISLTDLSVTDVSGDGSLSYNNTTGVITYTGPSASEVRAHFSAGTGIQISNGEIATTITQYTDTLARGAISVTDVSGDGSLAYNNTTGVITYTGPSASETRAHFSAGTGITITSGEIATTITQYTDTLARASISVTQNLTYDNTTGVITGPSLTSYEQTANKNQANGYAGLDSSGKVASAQLPSYVDDVLEYQDLASLPATGETGKIYVTLGTNKTYRWTGSQYVEISASPGSTDSVTEGSTNLYFTNTRSRESISVTDVSGDGSLAYNNTTGVITYTGPSASDVRAHFTAGTGIQISSGQISSTITQYTNSDADARISAASINALSDVVITTPSSGQVLKYNGTNWINDTDANSGDVTGPASSTDNAITRFDSTTGKLLQNSLVTISDTGAITAPSVGSVIPFYFDNQAAFPTASTYHGAIVHSHADGKMYFAHGGTWNALANASEIVANTDTTYTISAVDGTTGKKIIRLTAGGSGSGTDDVTLVAGTNITLDRANDEITINASSSSSNLDGLSDVVITTPTNGQVLKYNGTNWINDTDAGGGSNLDGLSDVVITTPTNGQVLKYNGTNWINDTDAGGGGNLDGLSDVVITTPTNGQVLKYNGTNWVNDTDATSAGGGASLDDVIALSLALG